MATWQPALKLNKAFQCGQQEKPNESRTIETERRYKSENLLNGIVEKNLFLFDSDNGQQAEKVLERFLLHTKYMIKA